MLDAELLQQVLHPAAGAVLLEAQLGVLVEVAADGDHPGQESRGLRPGAPPLAGRRRS